MSNAEEDSGSIEEWIYLGRDLAGKYRWRDPNGSTLLYDKLRATRPGGLYEIEVLRDVTASSVRVLSSTLRYLQQADVPEVAEIQTAAMRIEKKRASLALEKRTSRTEQIDQAAAPLLELAAKVNDHYNRAALADYVRDKIMGA